MEPYHIPVLLQAACDYLSVKPGRRYIDATLGGGGHSVEIVKRGGIVLGLDQDSDALSACPDLNHLTKVKSNFMLLTDVARTHGFVGVDGILFDLGVSSWQFDQPGRGFSFQKAGPLDMRMDRDSSTTAADLVNSLSETQLSRILSNYGQLGNSDQLAKKIVAARPLTTTDGLSRLFADFKTRQLVFQALRIATNAELVALESALPQAYDLLKSSGRLVVISFHSLEDRLVKKTFTNLARSAKGQVLTRRPVLGSKASKLRVFEKL